MVRIELAFCSFQSVSGTAGFYFKGISSFHAAFFGLAALPGAVFGIRLAVNIKSTAYWMLLTTEYIN
jgi:hypothetical protein